ncbi:MAG: hypothetical protein ACRESK_06315, partial [Gammaproteobacteria bacterium]
IMFIMFNNMFKKLLNLCSPRRERGAIAEFAAAAGAGVTTDTGQRYRELLGEEKMNQQLLYERWAVKDTWRLRDEALPLLYGIDPDTYEQGDHRCAVEESIQGLWTHARQCIEHNLLQVTNREQRDEDWTVEPLAIYQWAVISRMQLPEPFVALMDFVGRTVKKFSPSPVPGDPDGGQISAVFDEHREKVLGLALTVLARTPERCRNTDGKVAVELLVRAMKEQPCFKDHSGKLADSAILDLLNKYI